MSSSKRQLLLASSGYIFVDDIIRKEIIDLLKKNDVKTVLYIPYAKLPDLHNRYVTRLQELFEHWEVEFKVEGIHTKQDEVEAVKNAEAIFVCGGNTFALQKALCEKNLIEPIRKRCLDDGIPYIGYSAGTNVATRSIHTTNDMPVVLPPKLESLNLVPFNINVHYFSAGPNNQGETRDMRLEEFIQYNERPVLGLRDVSTLQIEGDSIKLLGEETAKFLPIFTRKELSKDSDLSFLLKLS